MKELIIHAGMPKNGSSALQVMFAKNYDALKELSIDYFKTGDFEAGLNGAITSGNGALLSRSLLGEKHEAYLNDPENTHLLELLKLIEASDSSIGIISSEFFTNIPKESIKLLKSECLKLGVVVKYFYYIRRQDQFLMSGYMQRVKRHHYTDYPETFIQNSYKNVGFLNYFSFSEGLSEVLDKKNVIVRNFDIGKKHKKGLAADFIETLGVDISKLTIENKIVNISPTPREIKTLLVLNKYKPSTRLTDGIVEDSIHFGRGGLGVKHSILKPTVCKEVLDYFSEQNEKVNKEYLPKEHILNLNSNLDETSYQDLKTLELDSMELLDIFSSIFVRLDKK